MNETFSHQPDLQEAPKPQWHPWQTYSIVRLYGEALTELRWEAFRRSEGRCEMQRFGQRCNYPITFENSEMAHVRNRRMYGDVIDNVLMSCK